MTKNVQSALHDRLARLAIAVTDLAGGLRSQTRRTDALVAKLAAVDRLAVLLEGQAKLARADVAPAARAKAAPRTKARANHREPAGDYSFWLGGQPH